MGASKVTGTCRHCGRTILLGPASPEPYWYHPDTQMIYCHPSYPDPGPGRRSLRAEPRG